MSWLQGSTAGWVTVCGQVNQITNTKVNSAFHPYGVGKLAGVKWGTFICVVTSYWQVTLRSSQMGFLQHVLLSHFIRNCANTNGSHRLTETQLSQRHTTRCTAGHPVVCRWLQWVFSTQSCRQTEMFTLSGKVDDQDAFRRLSSPCFLSDVTLIENLITKILVRKFSDWNFTKRERESLFAKQT